MKRLKEVFGVEAVEDADKLEAQLGEEEQLAKKAYLDELSSCEADFGEKI